MPAGCAGMLVGGLILTGLEKWRDMRASKVEHMCTGALICTHESFQRQRLDEGAVTFLWVHVLQQNKQTPTLFSS